MTVIGHVTAPAGFGGLERVVSGLARGTFERGHRVLLIAVLEPGSPTPVWASALKELGIDLECIAVPSRAYRTERQFVGRLLRRYGVRILHTHGYRSDILHGAVARAHGIPVVSTAHGFASSNLRGRIYEMLQRRAWRRFDAVVAVSRPLEAAIARSGVPRGRLRLIPNGVVRPLTPCLSRERARAALGLPASGPVIGWVGRQSAEKAPDVMLAAMAVVHQHAAVLCFVGDGPVIEASRELARRLGLSGRVFFAGAVPDASPLFRAFDVLVLSSRTEGTPMVVLEAAQSGVPVVATAVGGVPDMLAHDAGWLVPSEDPAALAAAIDEALADPHEARERGARLMNQLATRAHADTWIDQYVSLYTGLDQRAGDR